MLKASPITDGGIPIGTRQSDFKIVTSNGAGHYVPLDFQGAREVVLRATTGTMNGFITDVPVIGAGRQFIINAGDIPLVIHSTDDRLYWVSETADTAANLQVWLIY